ncbi:cytochrome c maturation protein CcmE [Cytobacillus praedii]|uniref:Cytochrome c maturation protein CcmE n=1 Tax=Cytobacillus praedii TaxID=1742358 RepID=A0A4R1B230_9BACI|nr:cytochrome c maturation protein CcmE [Cytobacillus praedii]MED3549008.1 cytochrome c maturation protein CcmE [Cytobacillus praedii]TCJ04553.1 cytochrome c maturation protein CcmE [Cytobacillus praedii]
MSKNKKIIFGLSLFAAAIMIMFFSTMPSAGSKEITIEELLTENYKDEYVLTQGMLKQDSVKWDADKIELTFEIVDEETNASLPIIYNGVKPDNFSDDVIVIVEGFIRDNGVFEAEKVQTKCPSKYEGEDTENYDMEMHKNMNENKQDE